MKLVLVMVTSIDGKSTHGNLPGTQDISSPGDQKHFVSIIENARLIIMGSTTYEVSKNSMQHKKRRLRIVVTSNPSKYENEKIPEQLEFSNESVVDLIQRLEAQGFSEGYLVGGAKTNTEFFKQGLVSEIWQTIEPKILGDGKGIVNDDDLLINLKLISTEILNDNGTLLLKYSVERG